MSRSIVASDRKVHLCHMTSYWLARIGKEVSGMQYLNLTSHLYLYTGFLRNAMYVDPHKVGLQPAHTMTVVKAKRMAKNLDSELCLPLLERAFTV